MRTMRVLVIGAAGGTGREIVRQALERKMTVTAFVRRPRGLDEEHAALRLARGDVLDADSLHAAVAGQDAVLCALGHKRFFYPNRILSRGTENLIEAMGRRRVRRLVCETSLGVGDSFGRLGLYYTLFTVPFILPFYYWDKGRQEAVIRRSDLDWTIVRPGALNNRPRRGNLRHGPDVGSYLWTVRISRADVAAFMLDQIDDRTYVRRAVGISW
jgi:putative NADH-flavin reductase